MLDLSDHCESLKRLADDENRKNNVHNVKALKTEYLHLSRLPLMVTRNNQDSRNQYQCLGMQALKNTWESRVMLSLYSERANSSEYEKMKGQRDSATEREHLILVRVTMEMAVKPQPLSNLRGLDLDWTLAKVDVALSIW